MSRRSVGSGRPSASSFTYDNMSPGNLTNLSATTPNHMLQGIVDQDGLYHVPPEDFCETSSTFSGTTGRLLKNLDLRDPSSGIDPALTSYSLPSFSEYSLQSSSSTNTATNLADTPGLKIDQSPFVTPTQNANPNSQPWIHSHLMRDATQNLEPAAMSQNPQKRPRTNRADTLDSAYGTTSQVPPSLRSVPSSSPAGLRTIQSGPYATPNTSICPPHPSSGPLSSHGLHSTRHLSIDASIDPPASDAGSSRCDECNVTFKTPAELKKHNARHDRKHFCDQPNCPRNTEGFATKNDLDRHRKTVHHISKPDDTYWKCLYPGCPKADKEWPRQDNFRAHITRMHGEKWVEEYTKKSDDWWASQRKQPFLTEASLSMSINDMAMPHTPNRTTQYTPQLRIDTSPSTEAGNRTNNSIGHLQRPRGASFGGLVSSRSNRMLLTPDSALRRSGQSIGRKRPHEEPRLDVTTHPKNYAQSMHTGEGIGQNNTPMTESILPWQYSYTPNFYNLEGATMQKAKTVADVRSLDVFETQPDMDHFKSMMGQIPESHDQLLPSTGAHLISGYENENAPNLHTFSPLGDNYGDSGIDNVPIDFDLGDNSQLRRSTAATQAAYQPSQESHFWNVLRKAGWNGPAEKERELRRLLAPDQVPNASNQTGASSRRSVHHRSVKESDSDVYKHFKCTRMIKYANGHDVMCNKVFERQNELRKHDRRHDRRFGCTFDFCYKRFGSKWEWRRHEDSQHEQREVWVCQSQSFNRGLCRKVFHNCQDYRHHLQIDHGTLVGDNDDFLDQHRVAKKFQGRFWCGFCPALVHNNASYGAARSQERYSHICNHIKNERVDMDDWVELEGEGKTKGQMRPVESRRQSGKASNYDVDDDDDDELDELDDSILSQTSPSSRPSSTTTISAGHSRARSKSLYTTDYKRAQQDSSLRLDTSTMMRPSLSEHAYSAVVPRTTTQFPNRRLATGRDRSVSVSEATRPSVSYVICCECRDGPHAVNNQDFCPICGHDPCSSCQKFDNTHQRLLVDTQPLMTDHDEDAMFDDE